MSGRDERAAENADRMRRALARCCTFPPGHPHKRFVRQIQATPAASLTVQQRRHIVRLAWRYRRQLPADCVPSKDAIEALDGR